MRRRVLLFLALVVAALPAAAGRGLRRVTRSLRDVQAPTAAADEQRLGNIGARDLPIVVPPAFGRVDVLGMNFLSRLKSRRVERRTLVLVPYHPQTVG